MDLRDIFFHFAYLLKNNYKIISLIYLSILIIGVFAYFALNTPLIIIYLPITITFLTAYFSITFHKHPEIIERERRKRKDIFYKDIKLGILKIFFSTIFAVGSVIAFIFSIISGYSFYSKIFFTLLSFLSIIWFYLITNNLSFTRYFKVISAILVGLMALLTIQSAVPLFSPKISFIMEMDTIYGWIEGDETYTGQNAILKIYPPLFPLGALTSCQEIPLGYKIRDFRLEKYSPLIAAYITPGINGQNTSILLCILNADAFMWNEISIPIYFRSIQHINPIMYQEDYNISYLDKYTTKKGYIKYYTNRYLINSNDFEVRLEYPKFIIYNGSDAWGSLLTSNCSYSLMLSVHDEIFENISLTNLGEGDLIANNNYTNFSTIFSFPSMKFNPNEEKNILLIFLPYECDGNTVY